ncbi:MAG TPA: sigma-54 dependent transcriptional regulator [Vicinamibacteria bacterium]|nr:sigma-54 dependent transcriptional regulator [Vicinamibacteria bacterium]
MSTGARVLIVDDEPKMARAIASALERAGHEAIVCEDAETALADALHRGADAVVTDWRMEGMDGMELLRRIQASRPETPVILVTAYGDVPSAVAAMREGAFDYVTKPFDNEELREIVARALELTRLRRENQELRRELSGHDADIVADSASMKAVLGLVERAAPSSAPVLILGESGTGKELVARRIHFGSRRVGRPYVAVNCKALAESVLESELFGHERGAFTGAVSARAGCFERADGGTLFLDEIGEVSVSFQAKILRAVQEGEIQRVGGNRTIYVNVRIVAATNRDLDKDVSEGRFREDLFFRLNVIPVRIPPLRERKDDVLPLARHFLSIQARTSGRLLRLSDAAEKALVSHSWPGNVRELANAIERASVLTRTDELRAEDLLLVSGALESVARDEGGSSETLQECLDRAAAERIREALEATGGRRAEAAARLGIERTTLFRWMKRLGV